MAKFCKNCGMTADDNARVCGNCGTPLDGGMPSYYPEMAYSNPAPTPDPKPKANIKVVIGTAIAVVAIVMIAVLLINQFGKGTTSEEEKEYSFQEEYSDIADETWCEIASDDSYMRLDTNPYDLDDGFEIDAWNKIEEINTDLGFSEALSEKMGETRSVDGRQSDENDDFEVSWSYHPDNGLEVMYEKK